MAVSPLISLVKLTHCVIQIEDAAVLGNLLSRLQHKKDLPNTLHAFQEIREPRVSEIAAETWLNRKIFHLPDGPEQQQRDSSMRAAMDAAASPAVAVSTRGNANMWADKEKNTATFLYDADEAVNWWCNQARPKL